MWNSVKLSCIKQTVTLMTTTVKVDSAEDTLINQIKWAVLYTPVGTIFKASNVGDCTKAIGLTSIDMYT